MDLAKHSLDGTLPERLEIWEQQLFKLGRRSLADYLEWQNGEGDQMKTSEMVNTHRKRKRDQIE